MATKIIMIIQYKHLLIFAVLLLIEKGSRQSADSSSYNNQVVLFFQFRWLVPNPIAQPMLCSCAWVFDPA